MGGIGAIAEPLVVIGLLIGGTWLNRDPESGRDQRTSYRSASRPASSSRKISTDDVETGKSVDSPTSTYGLLSDEDGDSDYDGVLKRRSTSSSLLSDQESKWRKRTIGIWGMSRQVYTPNTRRFRGRLVSRVLEKYPFLVEVWYWGLIYWVYQLGRAASAVFIVEGTVHAARNHALQIIALERYLHIFWELNIQAFFLRAPLAMTWINRIYSFIHIPGSIAFLIWLFYYTNTANRIPSTYPSLPTHRRQTSSRDSSTGIPPHNTEGSPAGPKLFESRRRTMALCNLLAFIIFTLYPCMPPRLLSSDTSSGDSGKQARSYGFIDTVHGADGEGSVWTENRFCNQYAAMPSLHFGYSLLIGLTVMSIPLNQHITSQRKSISLLGLNKIIRIPSWQRILCVVVGILYPATILTAILATANHFILDAVAGALVCGLAWWGNDVLLNLLVVEDWFLEGLGIAKPVRGWGVVDGGGGGVEGVVDGDIWARSKGGFVE